MRSIGRTRTAIGIDVGRQSIKAAQLSISGCSHQITAFSMLPRIKAGEQINPVINPESNGQSKSHVTGASNGINREEILKVKRVLMRQGFCGNDIVLAAPEEELLRGVFEIPRQVSGAPIAQIARMELSRIHNVAPDSFEMVCWEPPSSDKSKSMVQTIAVGYPHNAANVFTDLFEESGFNVIALDLRSAAAARACVSLTAPAPSLTSILDLGWNSTKLMLVSGAAVIYERFFRNKCMVKINNKLSQTFGITEESADQIVSTIGFDTDSQASELDQDSTETIRKILRKHFEIILEELEASFDYVNYQYAREGIKRLLLIGGGAKISGLPQHIQNVLGIEVISVTPTSLMESPSQILKKVDNPAMTVAVGLAMFDRG